MNSKEIIYIIIVSIFKTIIYMMLGFIIYNLLKFNYNLAIQFCTLTEIPDDLSLSVLSLGFANNLTFILTVIEISLFVPLFKLIDNFGKKAHYYICIY